METVKNTDMERVIDTKNDTSWSIKIAGSAIFAAISLIFSLLAPILPRVQWGLALFDPVSIIWILSFFIFGYEAGLITSVVGMGLLMFTDSWAPMGPIMKFTATIILIIIPFLTKFITKKGKNRETLFSMPSFLIDWLISVVIRSVIMLIFNIIVINLMFGGDFFAATIDLSFLGLPGVVGWTAIYATVIFINTLQSIWDYLIPYLINKIIQKNNKYVFW